jgi:hypothetical protein
MSRKWELNNSLGLGVSMKGELKTGSPCLQTFTLCPVRTVGGFNFILFLEIQ